MKNPSRDQYARASSRTVNVVIGLDRRAQVLLTKVVRAIQSFSMVQHEPQARAQSAVPRLKIDATKPTVAALIDEYDRSLLASDVGQEYRTKAIGALRQSALDSGWVFPSQITAESIVAYLLERKSLRAIGAESGKNHGQKGLTRGRKMPMMVLPHRKYLAQSTRLEPPQ